MYKHVIFSMAILINCHAFSQLQNVNWVFGYSIGLNFERGACFFLKLAFIHMKHALQFQIIQVTSYFIQTVRMYGIKIMKLCLMEIA